MASATNADTMAATAPTRLAVVQGAPGSQTTVAAATATATETVNEMYRQIGQVEMAKHEGAQAHESDQQWRYPPPPPTPPLSMQVCNPHCAASVLEYNELRTQIAEEFKEKQQAAGQEDQVQQYKELCIRLEEVVREKESSRRRKRTLNDQAQSKRDERSYCRTC